MTEASHLEVLDQVWSTDWLESCGLTNIFSFHL